VSELLAQENPGDEPGCRCEDRSVPVPASTGRGPDPTLDEVAAVLDPVLTPLGFAAGQAGSSGGQGQVIFCRGLVDSTDGGCVDLVVDLAAAPTWRVTDVRYWGYAADRWHLAFDPAGDLTAQLARLATTLPDQLTVP
jgi:hypothetical protein